MKVTADDDGTEPCHCEHSALCASLLVSVKENEMLKNRVRQLSETVEKLLDMEVKEECVAAMRLYEKWRDCGPYVHHPDFYTWLGQQHGKLKGK